MRVFDIHTHPIWHQTGTTPAEESRIIRHCRDLGITRVNILGDVSRHGWCQHAAQITEINDDSIRLAARHPGFYSFFCYLNPTLGERAVMREVERCVAHGVRGIKLEKANCATDPCMRHVARAAREFDLVVLQHSWSMDTHDSAKGGPKRPGPHRVVRPPASGSEGHHGPPHRLRLPRRARSQGPAQRLGRHLRWLPRGRHH